MSILLFRIVLLVAVVWLAYKLIRKVITPPADQKAQESFETMVSCSHCGLHLPKAEAVSRHGRHYCCAEHADLNKDG